MGGSTRVARGYCSATLCLGALASSAPRLVRVVYRRPSPDEKSDAVHFHLFVAQVDRVLVTNNRVAKVVLRRPISIGARGAFLSIGFLSATMLM